MKWLRLYNEARTDAKLESLPDDEFRVWHRLLCFANEQPNRGVIAGFTPRLLAVEVARGDVALLERTLSSLQELRIIAAGDNAYAFTKWEARQYDKPSDTPERVAERVATHRDRKRNADVTPCNADVTSCNAIDADADVDAEPEREQEAEQDTHADVAAVVPPHAHAHQRPAAATNASSGDVEVDLCERIAQRTHLPQRSEVMEQLSAVIQSHIARGLSPGDIERDVLNLVDPSRPKHIKRPSVTQISNWLAHTHPAENLAAAAVGASNGHRNDHGTGHHTPATGDRSHEHSIRGRRQPDLPDPTRNGRYATLVRVASDDGPDDDGPDDDGPDEAAHDA